MSSDHVAERPGVQPQDVDTGRTAGADDPDLARLIELVERIGGHGEEPA